MSKRQIQGTLEGEEASRADSSAFWMCLSSRAAIFIRELTVLSSKVHQKEKRIRA